MKIEKGGGKHRRAFPLDYTQAKTGEKRKGERSECILPLRFSLVFAFWAIEKHKIFEAPKSDKIFL